MESARPLAEASCTRAGVALTDGAGVGLDLGEQAFDDGQDGTDILALLGHRSGHGANEKAGKSEGGEELHCDCLSKE